MTKSPEERSFAEDPRRSQALAAELDMRTTMLTALATLALTCPGAFCLAQTASPGAAGSPQTLTGDGGLDGRAPDPAASSVLKDYPIAAPAKVAKQPKTGEAVRQDDGSRVGTLSPDETRRAARARPPRRASRPSPLAYARRGAGVRWVR